MTISPADLAATHRSRAGVVVAFDDDTGLGVIEGAGDVAYPFHCTAVADGSRHAEVGAAMAFVLVAGLGGRLEARELVPLEGPDAV